MTATSGPRSESVSVLGVGAMGSRIALRLLDAGHDVVVWNRSPDRLGPLLARGARPASSPRDAARRSRTLITMLADPDALRAVSEGPAGIAAGIHPDLVVVEMSTVAPPAVARLASILEPAVRVVDAPVLGSIAEAGAGTLTIFAGGSADVVDRIRPLLAALGTVVHAGPSGAGAAAKLVANAALLGTITVLGETLSLAAAVGLSREAAAQVLDATALAEQARRRLPLLEDGTYPRRFGLALARKDADLIVASAQKSGVRLGALNAMRDWFAAAEQQGRGDRDYTAVLATILHGDSGHPAPPSAHDGGYGYDGLIIDLDGVVWLGGHPIDGVAETLRGLRARGVRTLFLTNDPQHSRATQAQRLSAIGIPATAGDVVTASAAAASFLAGQDHLAGTRTLIVGSQALRHEFRSGTCPA